MKDKQLVVFRQEGRLKMSLAFKEGESFGLQRTLRKPNTQVISSVDVEVHCLPNHQVWEVSPSFLGDLARLAEHAGTVPASVPVDPSPECEEATAL